MKNTSLAVFKKNIKKVKVQGASSVALTTLQQVVLLMKNSRRHSSPRDLTKLCRQGETLAKLRPAEPLARNLIRWLVNSLQLQVNHKRWQADIRRQERMIKSKLDLIDKLISKSGSTLIKSGSNIFTHCHSSQVEKILQQAKKVGKKFIVWHTETRPLFQGRITEKHLKQAGIKSVLVVDSAAAWLVSNHSGDRIKINLVLLGADSIERDGSVINKIGSFGIALAAYESRIPVYIVASLLKLDWDKQSKVELRSEQELWPQAPKATRILNYAFDKVPAKFITGIVTEAGIIKPVQVKTTALKFYPWLKKYRKTD